MNDLKWLVDISITSSITAFIIVLVRLIFGRNMTAKWKYYLWFILIIRLMYVPLPVSTFSIFQFVPAGDSIQQRVESMSPVPSQGYGARIYDNRDTVNISSAIDDENTYEHAASSKTFDLYMAAPYLYVLPASLLILYSIIFYFLLLRKIRRLKPAQEEEVLNRFEDAKRNLGIKRTIPLVYGESAYIAGLINPVLVIPEGFTCEELDAVFIHELIHYKYGDLWINWLLTILRSVYWFNPVVWLSFRQMRRDCELACDERVLSYPSVNKKTYAAVLLKNILVQNRYAVGTTSFSNKESDLKKRIKFIGKFKKPGAFWLIISLLIAGIVICLCLTNGNAAVSSRSAEPVKSNKVNIQEEPVTTPLPEASLDKNLASVFEGTVKIDVYHRFFNSAEVSSKPVTVSDKALVDYFVKLLSQRVSPDSHSMSGVSVKNQKLVLYDDKGKKTELIYSYDTLYNFGYFIMDGEKFFVTYDLFRLIASVHEYRASKVDIPQDAYELLKKYNWTPAFLLGTAKKTIPSSLVISSDQNAEKIYWAHGMELSKAAGLDFTNLLSKEVTAEIYYLIEPLPGFAKPYLDARGIIIRHNGNIVGTFIDGGRTGVFSTLDGRSFKDVKGVELYSWLAENCFDKNDEMYRKISAMSPEELIRTYFKAQEDRDTKTLLSTMSMSNWFHSLFLNMGDRQLFSSPKYGTNLPGYIDKINIISIKEISMSSNPPNTLEYAVEADIKPTSRAVIGSGRQTRFVILVKEGGIFRVNGDGTGP